MANLFEGALAWNIYDVKQVSLLRGITNYLKIYSIIALPHEVFLKLLKTTTKGVVLENLKIYLKQTNFLWENTFMSCKIG